jgi:DeoR/GlpR family transcriptional regulator of sugar metabolism
MKGETSYYEVRGELRLFSKYAVALRAVALIEEGDSILIDAGTSLTPIARIIRKLAGKHPNQTHYTIMTHNQAAFNALSDVPPVARFNVFQTGGRYDRDLNASFGHQAEMAYQRFHPRWVFIGQNGMEADLGLFCHGNTEELALKRNIFAMPAWGRIIISDFGKIGVPGGLLFGDSMNLTTNVNECWIITDDLHDEKFKHVHIGDLRKQHQDRFETQVRSLQETYQARVDSVHFAVSQTKYKEVGDKIEYIGAWELMNDPIAFLEKSTTKKKERRKEEKECSDAFRIEITDDDIKENLDGSAEEKERAYVEISFSETDGKTDISILDAELFWDSQGKSTIRRKLEKSSMGDSVVM